MNDTHDAARLKFREAGSRGGRAITAAKLATLAELRQRRDQARAERIRALLVPAPFRILADFLGAVAAVAGTMEGGQADLARHVGVDTSRVTKWLRSGGRHTPSQAQLDAITAWWRAHRDGAAAVLDRQVAPSRVTAPARVSLSRLPEHLSARLRRAAKLRNLDALKLAEQILDRHLPQLDDMR